MSHVALTAGRRAGRFAAMSDATDSLLSDILAFIDEVTRGDAATAPTRSFARPES